jgi:elongation factor Ts
MRTAPVTTEISATLVKTLRDRTGAGIMACRSTLAETNGDLDAAIERLRDAQTTMAAKKADRQATEGLVALAVEGARGALVEVNCETDFVARGDEFRRAVASLAPLALAVAGERAALLAAPAPGGEGSVADLVTRLSARTGERVSIRRTTLIDAGAGTLASYVHGAVAPGVGVIGVLVALESRATGAALADAGRRIAMHVAASEPTWVSEADIPAAVLVEKRSELQAQAHTTGKPAGVVERMVEGRLRKFVGEVVLLEQPFIMNPDETVEQALAAAAAGTPVRVRGFVRFRVGGSNEQ